MTALYPTLEDLVIDQYQSAQRQKEVATCWNPNHLLSGTSPSTAGASEFLKVPTAPIYEYETIGCFPPNCSSLNYTEPSKQGHIYPIAPSYFLSQTETQSLSPVQDLQTVSHNAVKDPKNSEQIVVGNVIMVAPLTCLSSGIHKANITHAIRQVILLKNKKKEKYGLRFRSVNKGIFVQFVEKESIAAAANIRFGDQILKVNDTEVVGMDGAKVLDLMTKPKDAEQVMLTIRDRPFERTITLHKDSAGMFGFGHKDNLITAITKDSSASRNGLITEQRILEIDGRNIIGFSTKEVKACLKEAPQTATFTLMPGEIYDELVKKLGSSLMRKQDHSSPEI